MRPLIIQNVLQIQREKIQSIIAKNRCQSLRENGAECSKIIVYSQKTLNIFNCVSNPQHCDIWPFSNLIIVQDSKKLKDSKMSKNQERFEKPSLVLKPKNIIQLKNSNEDYIIINLKENMISRFGDTLLQDDRNETKLANLKKPMFFL